MSDPIGKALREATIPDSSQKRKELALLASQGHSDDAERPRAPSTSRWKTFRRLPSAALAALLLAAFLSVTPPGRALASDIAGLVGIGDEPTLDQSRDQDFAADGPAVVVARGTIPGTDQIYEISAYEASGDGTEASKRPHSCLNFDLPGLDRQSQVDFSSVCTDRPLEEPLQFGSATDNLTRLGPNARFSAGGLLSTEVADVSVSYEDASGDRVDVPVALAVLDDSVARQTGAPVTFGRFEAFFPDDGLPGEGPGVFGHPFFETIEVVAYDRAGGVIGQDTGKKFVQPPPSITTPKNAFSCEGGTGPPICEAIEAQESERPVQPESPDRDVAQAASGWTRPTSEEEVTAQPGYPEDYQDAVDQQYRALIVMARKGQLNADVAPERVIRLLGMAIDPPQDPQAGKRLETRMLALTDELRAAGDLPPSGHALEP